MSFEGKNLYGQYIDYSEKKKKMAQGLHLPLYWDYFYNIRIYSRSQVSVYRTIGPLVLADLRQYKGWQGMLIVHLWSVHYFQSSHYENLHRFFPKMKN